MSTPDTSPSEEPVIDYDPVMDTSEQQVPSDHDATIDDLSSDELLELIHGGSVDHPLQDINHSSDLDSFLEEIPAGHPAGHDAQSPDDGEEPDDGDALRSTPAEGINAKQRLSVRALPPDQQRELAQALDLVRDHQAPDVATAIHQLRGTAAPVHQPAAPAPDQASAEAEVSHIESEIAHLRAQRDAASDDFDRPEERRLTALIEDRVGLLAQARISVIHEQQYAAAYTERFESAVDELESRYPAVLDEHSSFHKLLDAKVIAAKVNHDPALHDPNYILKFAEELEGMLHPTRRGAGAIPPKPATRSSMGNAVAPARTSAPRSTRADMEALIKNARAEDLLAVIADR
jgi:hypothetical protein